jgi:hypothetical protein
MEAPEEEQQKQLINGSGKLAFLKLLLPKLKARGHRVLLFSQVCPSRIWGYEKDADSISVQDSLR